MILTDADVTPWPTKNEEHSEKWLMRFQTQPHTYHERYKSKDLFPNH